MVFVQQFVVVQLVKKSPIVLESEIHYYHRIKTLSHFILIKFSSLHMLSTYLSFPSDPFHLGFLIKI
jgi:hypothetical protein